MVTYFPTNTFPAVIREIARQFSYVVIIDNGSKGKALRHVESSLEHPNVTVIFNLKNVGLGAALNAGIEECLMRGASWVATFDQDTLIPSGYVERLSAEILRCQGNPEIAMLSCSFEDNSKVYQSGPSGNKRETELGVTMEAITSGAVVNLRALRVIGGFNESFFIDYIDHEIVLRMLREGYKVVRVPDIVIEHQIGRGQPIRIMGLQFNATNHPPARLFTIYRNLIVVLRRYFRVAPRRIALLVLRDFFRIIKIILFERNKAKKLWAVLCGIRSGLIAKVNDRVTEDNLLKFKV